MEDEQFKNIAIITAKDKIKWHQEKIQYWESVLKKAEQQHID